MNLTKLFEAQRALDDHIIKEKGLEGQDLLPNLILALQVELGELANEWRGFKHWSNDREPRVRQFFIKNDFGKWEKVNEHPFDDEEKGIRWKESFPLLEEYVDCMHFILSIGNHIGYNDIVLKESYSDTQRTTTEIFLHLFHDAFHLGHEQQMSKMEFEYFIVGFLELGELLGFTPDQIKAAYFEKNAVNHQRQENGY